MNNPVIELVKAYEGFVNQNPAGSLEEFCEDFVNKIRMERFKMEAYEVAVPEGIEVPKPSDEMGRYLARVTKHLHFYSRKIMLPLPIDNLEDFAYLAESHFGGAMKRSELINQNLSEFTSGTNVINRLIKAGYLEEFPDPEDARSKQVKITPEGIKTLLECIPQMYVADKVLFGILTEEEKMIATQVLRKIDSYHSRNFTEFRNLKLDEIRAQLKV
jgi:DNA-binding MarR family transcriptional regulator